MSDDGLVLMDYSWTWERTVVSNLVRRNKWGDVMGSAAVSICKQEGVGLVRTLILIDSLPTHTPPLWIPIITTKKYSWRSSLEGAATSLALPWAKWCRTRNTTEEPSLHLLWKRVKHFVVLIFTLWSSHHRSRKAWFAAWLDWAPGGGGRVDLIIQSQQLIYCS